MLEIIMYGMNSMSCLRVGELMRFREIAMVAGGGPEQKVCR